MLVTCVDVSHGYCYGSRCKGPSELVLEDSPCCGLEQRVSKNVDGIVPMTSLAQLKCHWVKPARFTILVAREGGFEQCNFNLWSMSLEICG